MNDCFIINQDFDLCFAGVQSCYEVLLRWMQTNTQVTAVTTELSNM